jgi:hypothetical protein
MKYCTNQGRNRYDPHAFRAYVDIGEDKVGVSPDFHTFDTLVDYLRDMNTPRDKVLRVVKLTAEHLTIGETIWERIETK